MSKKIRVQFQELRQSWGSRFTRCIILLIRAYQIIRRPTDVIFVSVFGFSSKCKQIPTCSEYTMRQIKKHGTIRGISRGILRWLQCV